MKILHISDLHLGKDDYSELDNNQDMKNRVKRNTAFTNRLH